MDFFNPNTQQVREHEVVRLLISTCILPEDPAKWPAVVVAPWVPVTYGTPPLHDVTTQAVRQVLPVVADQRCFIGYEAYDLDPESIAANLAAQREMQKQVILDQILALQQKCLRCLIDDAPDTTWLDQYKAQIAALRAQIAEE